MSNRITKTQNTITTTIAKTSSWEVKLIDTNTEKVGSIIQLDEESKSVVGLVCSKFLLEELRDMINIVLE